MIIRANQIKHTVVACAVVLGSCINTSDRAQDVTTPLHPGEIIKVGEDTYRVRETEPREDPYGRARQVAGEYCKKLNRVMVIKDGVFGLGEGEVLTFRCIEKEKVKP